MKSKIKYKYLHFIFHFYYSPLSPIKKKKKQFIFVYKKLFKHLSTSLLIQCYYSIIEIPL